MICEIHKYDNGKYQITLPQGSDSIELGNKITKEELLLTISKMVDLIK